MTEEREGTKTGSGGVRPTTRGCTGARAGGGRPAAGASKRVTMPSGSWTCKRAGSTSRSRKLLGGKAAEREGEGSKGIPAHHAPPRAATCPSPEQQASCALPSPAP